MERSEDRLNGHHEWIHEPELASRADVLLHLLELEDASLMLRPKAHAADDLFGSFLLANLRVTHHLLCLVLHVTRGLALRLRLAF